MHHKDFMSTTTPVRLLPLIATVGLTASAVLRSSMGNYEVAVWQFICVGAMILCEDANATCDKMMAHANEALDGWKKALALCAELSANKK